MDFDEEGVVVSTSLKCVEISARGVHVLVLREMDVAQAEASERVVWPGSCCFSKRTSGRTIPARKERKMSGWLVVGYKILCGKMYACVCE